MERAVAPPVRSLKPARAGGMGGGALQTLQVRPTHRHPRAGLHRQRVLTRVILLHSFSGAYLICIIPRPINLSIEADLMCHADR